jgi:aspartate aminotransferase
MTTLYDIFEKVHKLEQQGRRIVKFNVGDPDQSTDKRIIDACTKAMKDGYTKYGSATGEPFLRKQLAEEHGVKEENVFVSSGSKFSVYAAMDALMQGGDNVIVPSPHWNAYELIAKKLGGEARYVKTRMELDWQIDPAMIENAIDARTRAIIICNPSNPTSSVVREKVLDAIVEISERKKVPIISDECYADISFKKVKSVTDYGKGNICIKSFSKTFAMTGWRIGYMVTDKKIVDHATKLAQITTTNVPVFIQYAASKALEIKSEVARKMSNAYKKRAEVAVKALSRTRLVMNMPDAPFYLFPYCTSDSEPLSLNLIDRGVAIVPGSVFGDYKKFFRMALTIPDNDIKAGLDILTREFEK